MDTWRVHHIEGASLRSGRGLDRLHDILQGKERTQHIITLEGETDTTGFLLSLIDLAEGREERLWSKIEELREDRFAMVESMVSPEFRQDSEEKIRQDLKDLEDLLRAVWIVGDCSLQTRHYISSLGTVWISRALTSSLQERGWKAVYADAASLLTIRFSESGPEILWEQSRAAWEQFIGENSAAELIVIPGGIAALEGNGTTAFPRNGAELSASVFANLCDAEEIHLWREVPGVMSADSEKVPAAVVIPQLSYQEASELAFFGADVLHPQAMNPAIMKNIPIYIQSFMECDRPGTRISSESSSVCDRPVKGFSVIEDISLLNIEGAGMIGVPGISSRLFHGLNSRGISVVLISQASSEHSICCAVPSSQGKAAQQIAEEAFASELEHVRINSITIETGCAILAAVGEQMSGTPGISAAFFGSLGKAGVNVRAIAQGSSERNISAVIWARDAVKALRAVHAGFYLSPQSLSIGIIGPGLIGGTLIKQIAGESERLRNDFHVDLRVRAITDSKKMALAETGLDIADWKNDLQQRAVESDINRFVDHVAADYFPHSVIIDCTSSSSLPGRYTEWLSRGIHIITPNKKAGTAPLEEYNRMMAIAKDRRRHFLYETTVGAGLPIIGTLRDLIQTGDRILKIEGVFSGTLAYLFWRFDGSAPFSSLVSEAKELGYTEPDPRDDLSGMDIVRKTVILAREVGYPVEIDTVPVRSLVPEPLRSVSCDQFLAEMSQMDEEMDHLLREAKAKGEVLKYTGSIDENGHCTVDLKGYPSDHPFARISGSDNIVAFTTERYKTQPLVVQGPGAGPEVTAGGIFGDLLRLASFLGAKL